MMQWFLNLSVRAKVSVGMGLMVLCLGIVIFTAYTSIKSIEQSQDLVLGAQIERFHKMRAIIEELQQQAAKAAQTAVEQAARDASHAIGIFVVIGLLALLSGIAMIVLLNWVIASPLKDISNTAA